MPEILPLEERFRSSEWNVGLVRFLVVLFNSLVYLFLLDKAGTIPWLAYTIIVVANLYSLAALLLPLPEVLRAPAMATSAVTSVTDSLLIGAWVIATGGFASPFYVLWYISLVAVAFRFDVRGSLAATLGYGALYLAILAAEGSLGLHPVEALVRVGYILLVGSLTTLMSREVSRQYRRKAEMQALVQVEPPSVRTGDVGTALPDILRTTMNLLDADMGGVFLLEPGDQLVAAHAEGLPQSYLDAQEARNRALLHDGSPLGDEPYYQFEDAQASPAMAPLLEPLKDAGIRTMVTLILQVEGAPIGAMTLYRRQVRPFTRQELELGRTLADRAGVTLENLRLVADLRASEERFRALTESATDAIVTTDQRGRVAYMNPAAERIFGADGGTLRQHPLSNLLPELPPEALANQVDGGGSDGGPGREPFETVAFPQQGEPFPVEVSLARWSTGEGTFYTAIVRDITERRDREEALARHAAELARSNAELEQFAYVASHDLQEPLRMVASYVQLLERRLEDDLDEDSREFIGYAVEGVKRMQSLIRDLLAFSRVGTQGGPLSPVDLEGVLEEVLATLDARLEEEAGEVSHDPLPEVLGDAGQLAQVLQNLLTNALKFRREDVAPRVHLSARRDGDTWTVSVTDNGIGISPEHRERIFILFQRLHTRDRYPGTGIGLALCKKIVERHGGRIWVESEPGRGSTFRFTLLDAEATPEPPVSEPGQAASRTAARDATLEGRARDLI